MAIISYRHKFIFIKTVKTAGTSIEVDLSQVAGDDAIVTRIMPPVANHHARNYLGGDGQVAFYNHMLAKQIRALIGPETFNGMFKFCVEREPVAKCISQFHMLRNSPLHNSDGQYVKDWNEYCDEGKFPIDVDKYSEIRDGRRVLLVDRVLAYENIAQTLPEILQQQGVPKFSLKSQEKAEYSRDVLIRKQDVTASQRAKIYGAFKASCTLTGMYQA